MSYFLLTIAILTLYSFGLDCAWQFDDVEWLELPQITGGISQIPHLFDGTQDHCVERGLAMTSFNLDYSLWGAKVFGFHLTNIAFHLLAVFLVYALARHLIRLAIPLNDYKAFPQDKLLAFCTALLFAMIPVQTYSVVYVTQRMEIMAACGILACLWFYIQGRYWLSMTAFALGCFCKETAYISPLVIVSYHYFRKWHDGYVSSNSWVLAGYFYAAVFLYLVNMSPQMGEVFAGREEVFEGGGGVPSVIGHMDFFSIPFIVAANLKILLFPIPNNISIEYLDVFPKGTLAWLCYVSGLTAGIMLVIELGGRRYFKLLVYSTILFFLSFLIYLAVLPILTEKVVVYRLYLAAFPFLLFSVVFVWSVIERKIKTEEYRTAAVVLFMLCMSGIYFTSSGFVMETFKTQESFILNAYRHAPDKPRCVFNYAQSLHEKASKAPRGRVNLVEVELAGDLYTKTINMVIAKKEQMGDAGLELAIRAWNNLGVLYSQIGQNDKALECYSRVDWHPVGQRNKEALLAKIQAKENAVLETLLAKGYKQ